MNNNCITASVCAIVNNYLVAKFKLNYFLILTNDIN